VTKEIGQWCAANAPEADHRPNGWLWTATAPAHVGSWDGAVELADRVAPGVFERLSSEDIAARTGSPVHLAGVLDSSAATVDPGALARGLMHAAVDAGVRIYERSEVVKLDRGDPITLTTDSGTINAQKAVIATNAWAAKLRELRNALVVVSSDIVATPPIPDRLEQIGWTGDEAITNSQLMVNYYRTTRDGRIAFGKGGWGIAFGGHITGRFDRDRERAQAVTAAFRATYPMLEDVQIADDWCGPIDRSADGLPLIGHLGGRRNILYAVGWSGNGVGPSLLGAKTVASLALESDDDWSRSPLVDRQISPLPPEPIRYIGAHAVREAVRRKEAAELAGRRPKPLARALARLVPAGLEDH
jgi:glycine/D-amino acid oxidase-like deaminating enzyme